MRVLEEHVMTDIADLVIHLLLRRVVEEVQVFVQDAVASSISARLVVVGA
jgi:hypothetical protein